MVEATSPGSSRNIRVLVVDHHDSYVWNLAHLVAAVTGDVPDVVEHDEDVDLSGYSHLMLSPGPGHPGVYDWSILDAGLPTLGVCLGMQGIVTHSGGVVAPVEPAHGVVASIRHTQDQLFEGIPDDFAAVRYHSLAATELPDDLAPIAWSEDGVVQAVRHRSRPHVGVQFHPESILSEHGSRIIENFLELP